MFVKVGGIACDSYLASLQLRKLYFHFVGRPFTEVARREWAVSLDRKVVGGRLLHAELNGELSKL